MRKLSLLTCLFIPLVLAPGPGHAQAAAMPGKGADGKAVYEKSCGKCHSGGPGGFFTGAPRIGKKKFWNGRLAAAGSVDPLVANTLKGTGKMPAQLGVDGLTEAQIRAAVEYLVAQ